MEPWELLLVTFGGNAALLFALGWLARSLGSQFLAKDLERFKASLASSSAANAEKIKHELQLAAAEHHIRFSRLHERRGEVIANLYGLLVEAQWASRWFVSPLAIAGSPTQRKQYEDAVNAFARFYREYDRNRIFLPHGLCDKFEELFRVMRTPVLEFGVHIADNDSPPDQARTARHQAWSKAIEQLEEVVPEARSELERELRKILNPRADQVAGDA